MIPEGYVKKITDRSSFGSYPYSMISLRFTANNPIKLEHHFMKKYSAPSYSIRHALPMRFP
jgi:hypothetical protein